MGKPRSSVTKVAIVVGGESGEHEISLRSGEEVLAHLDTTRWEPLVVRIEQDGSWCFPAGRHPRGPAERLPIADGIRTLLAHEPAVVFPVMHGPYGEDGKFQALTELLHLRCVGSGSEASALAMNKARARDVFQCAGMCVAPAQELRRGEPCTIEAPCVVKPMHLGSSVGLMVVRTQDALEAALAEAFEHDSVVLVEKFIAGRELTAGVLEAPDGSLMALPLVEIRPVEADFFDFHAKYTPGASDEICPAEVSDAVRTEVQRIGLIAHRVLGCRTMSRTDVILDADGVVWVLETNTIPGMTVTSLLPQAAAEIGFGYGELVSRLIESAL